MTQKNDGKELTYDYAELDEYLSNWIVPNQLDEYFRVMHSAFTAVLHELINAEGSEDLGLVRRGLGIVELDKLFRIIGRLKEGGQS